MDLSPSREAASCAATEELPSILFNPQDSLPCSQEPSTGPYPEPDQSSPYHPILSLQNLFLCVRNWQHYIFNILPVFIPRWEMFFRKVVISKCDVPLFVERDSSLLAVSRTFFSCPFRYLPFILSSFAVLFMCFVTFISYFCSLFSDAVSNLTLYSVEWLNDIE
jgi:hypothetical protein